MRNMTFMWKKHAKTYSQTSLKWCPLGNSQLRDKIQVGPLLPIRHASKEISFRT